MPFLAQLASWTQILAWPTALIGILIAILIARRSRERKALSCEFNPVISPVEIAAGKALDGDIAITYQGFAVDNLFLVQAKIENTGNVPITERDIVQPPAFHFKPGAILLRKPEILNAKPMDLEVSWRIPAGDYVKAELRFELLNPGDQITVEFLLTGSSGMPHLTSRIEGIRKIDIVDAEELKQQTLYGFVASSFILLSYTIALTITFVMTVTNSLPQARPSPVTLALLMAGMLLVLLLAIVPGQRLIGRFILRIVNLASKSGQE